MAEIARRYEATLRNDFEMAKSIAEFSLGTDEYDECVRIASMYLEALLMCHRHMK